MSILDFSTKIGSKRFSNPIFTASGCASSGQELSQFFPLSELGAIVTKSIMTKPRTGASTCGKDWVRKSFTTNLC